MTDKFDPKATPMCDLEKCVKQLLKVLKKHKHEASLDVTGWNGKDVRNIGYALNKHGYEIDWNQRLIDGQLQKDYNTILIGRI
jgi:flavorubredoxin